MKKKFSASSTSWEPAASWYDGHVGLEGHYYHKQVILPALLQKWKLNAQSSILDLACGQGVLARAIPPHIPYLGVDASSSLVESAKKVDKNPHHRFLVADITKPFPLQEASFTHAACILALQNLENPLGALQNAAKALKNLGTLVLVINHPCFRIPRQSSWGIDEKKKLQYRRIDRYLSSLKIPIQVHPGKEKMKQEKTTYSFHYSLSQISLWLQQSSLYMEHMQELCSDKVSYGKNSKMENLAREEFPLFLVIHAKKIAS